MNTLYEKARETPIIHECDICVIGGKLHGSVCRRARGTVGRQGRPG